MGRRWGWAGVLVLAGAMLAHGQGAPGTQTPGAGQSGAGGGVMVDQVIAVVNGDLVLESDVDEDRRFQAFQPFRAETTFSRQQAIERLIDRLLIVQQARLQPDLAVSDAEVNAQLQLLRKDIPACRQEYHCETDAGWARFVHDQGFTMEELTERWRQRMEILKFVEERFRSGIRIAPAEIKAYYDKTLVPEYAKQKVPAPPLDTISDRIQEILLQQQVTALLDDWLKSLRAQGAVRMMQPGEVQL